MPLLLLFWFGQKEQGILVMAQRVRNISTGKCLVHVDCAQIIHAFRVIRFVAQGVLIGISGFLQLAKFKIGVAKIAKSQMILRVNGERGFALLDCAPRRTIALCRV